MSRDIVQAISRLFSSRIYNGRDFSLIQRECSSVEIVECRKKALFCGDCCDRNQAMILVLIVLFSLIFIH